jgi:arylmalonate decarboxylase
MAEAHVKSLTAEDYAEAAEKIPAAVDAVVTGGAQGVAIMGTSLTFFKGRAFNEELQSAAAKRSGLPATTMSTAIVEGLKAFNARRIAVTAAYSEDVTNRLTRFLEEHDLEPAGVRYFDLVAMGAAGNVTTGDLVEMSREAVKESGADALLISCGGLRTIEATQQLEAELGLPVVSSPIAAAWAAVRLVGHSGVAQGGGRLLEAGDRNAIQPNASRWG